MTPAQENTARSCLHAAENGTMTFPEIVQTLMQADFESYSIDFRRSRAIYFPDDGASVELAAHTTGPVTETFDVSAVQAAIREAQQLVPGYTYKGFCQKVTKAGCAKYIVSFLGRRAVYFRRTAETHVENFPR